MIMDLLNDIDTLADEVIEEDFTPENCCLRLKEIINNYTGKKNQEQALKCIDDLNSLCEVIMAEQSTPDVIQDYLFHVINHYQKTC